MEDPVKPTLERFHRPARDHSWRESVPDVADSVGHEVSAGSGVESHWLEFQPVVSGWVAIQREEISIVYVIEAF